MALRDHSPLHLHTPFLNNLTSPTLLWTTGSLAVCSNSESYHIQWMAIILFTDIPVTTQ